MSFPDGLEFGAPGGESARALSDVHLAMLAINSHLCPTDEAPLCKPLPEFKADVIHNTGRFLMMENSQRFNPALSQWRNGTVAHSSG